jgi:hypothetical protein
MPNAVQRHTVRSLIDNRRATSRTVSRSGINVREPIMSAPRETSLVTEHRAGIDRSEHLRVYCTLVHISREVIGPATDGAKWHEVAENGTSAAVWRSGGVAE